MSDASHYETPFLWHQQYKKIKEQNMNFDFY